MARQQVAGVGSVELSIRVAAAATDLAGSVLPRRRSSADKQEWRLKGFVRFVASAEWAGNALGTLNFLWATMVLMGGYFKDLKIVDFWYATAMIFIEAFRMFTRNYRSDDQCLFRTTRAIRAISSPFVRMLVRPQEWNELAAITGLFVYLVVFLTRTLSFADNIMAALIIFMSKLQFPGALQLMSRPRRYRLLLLLAVLASILMISVLYILVLVNQTTGQPGVGDIVKWLVPEKWVVVPWCCVQLAAILVQVVAVLLLSFRPPRFAHVISSPYGSKLLSSAKVLSVLYLLGDLSWFHGNLIHDAVSGYLSLLCLPFATLVLSISSLQAPANGHSSKLIDIILHMCFFGELVSSLARVGSGLAVIVMLVVLLIGTLQIPAAVARIVLSSLRLGCLAGDYAYDRLKDGNTNLVTSLVVFYVLTLCQGTLYMVACVSDPFSFFLRRSLACQLGLRGKRGARGIDLYYHWAYLKCMEIGFLAAGKEISLESFAIESLSSNSRKAQLAGVHALYGLLQQMEDIASRIASSDKTVSTLISMLGWTDAEDRDIRLFAAKVTVKLAGSLSVTANPSMLKLVSSLLDAEAMSATVSSSADDIAGDNNVVGNARTRPRRPESYISRCWWQMKERCSIPAELPLTHQDSFIVLGMLILEGLAFDHDNCAEIGRATELISKITGFIGYTSVNHLQQKAVVCASLNLVMRLAITGGKIGAMLRKELWEDPFLFGNLAGILEDSRSSIKVWEPAMDIIAKLALTEEARQEIGSSKVIVRKLMHAFLGRYGPTNMHYSQPLRLAAAEALANLAIESTTNCIVILEEPGYKVIEDLKDMLWSDKYRYVAATLLQILYEHSRDKMCSLGADEHLSFALLVVMEKIMIVDGKKLEILIGLASQIRSIPECVLHSLESHLGVSEFVQKMVSVLHANKKPNPEYPRMRRVILELTISIIESHPRYTAIFKEKGMIEALSKIESNPSKVEKYRIFLGNAGVILESGLPLHIIVAKAKGLINSTPTREDP